MYNAQRNMDYISSQTRLLNARSLADDPITLADNTQIAHLNGAPQLSNSNELENAFLEFLQTVVILILQEVREISNVVKA
jgi:hypothetical protein